MNRRFWIILPALLLLALGGCETVAPKDEAPEEVAVEDQGTTTASTTTFRVATLATGSDTAALSVLPGLRRALLDSGVGLP